MNRIINFTKRNLKEVLRDPIVYIFCLAFPFVMLVLFQVIGNFTQGNTPMFNLPALIPGIIMFSYTFVMLNMALIVSKDRQTFFLKRLYSSPMKSYEFVLGYAIVGFLIGLAQTIICIISGFILAIISKVEYISIISILLLILSQLPILITFIFLGILFGTIFNDKSAPGLCSVLISLAGMLGGCWMPLDVMGGFETFCSYLPFYPSVYIGRIITNATKTLGDFYTFDRIAVLGVIIIGIFTLISIILSFITFKNKMISDN
ncbi:MAG: ABC transporter permease [Clostridia bacterium]|nr:ABC transporter permease [Clostridia bacterium]